MHHKQYWLEQIGALYDECYKWSMRCCYFDNEMAKDVLHTVYLKIYEGRAVFNRKSQLKTWLFTIIYTTSIDYWRKYRMRYESLSNHHYDIAADEKINVNGCRDVLVRSLLQVLSAQQREVFTLSFYHELTLETIAQQMKISVGSVRTHYDRGKRKLRKLSEQFMLDNDEL